jgi:DinB superfamily
MSHRAQALADTLEQGAESLATLASGLTPAEWQSRIPGDGRKVGVVVHHVASIYPLEIELAQKLAAGGALKDLTWDAVHQLNAGHARENDAVTPDEAIGLLRANATAAAEAIRRMTDEELDRVAPNSLYGGAPLSCQFMLEDHAVRHSFHHVARIRAALKR